MTPIIIDENFTNETPQESQPVAYEFKPAPDEPPPDSEALERKAE